MKGVEKSHHPGVDLLEESRKAGESKSDSEQGYHAVKSLLEGSGIKVHELSGEEARKFAEQDRKAKGLTTPNGVVYGWTCH